MRNRLTRMLSFILAIMIITTGGVVRITHGVIEIERRKQQIVNTMEA